MSGITNGAFATLRLSEPEVSGLEDLLEDPETRLSGPSAKFDLHAVSQAARMIDSSGVVEQVAKWRAEDTRHRHPGGRERIVTDRVILIVLLLLAREYSPLLGTGMGVVLYRRLTAEAREFLGLPSIDTNRSARLELRSWQNAANYAFHRLAAPLDPYPDTPHY
ncbi:MAG: hypothetical protein ABIT21_00965, partial [Terrimesophilobacter sp.]